MKTASKWIAAEIERVQNPTDCETAKYMYCPVFNSCGAGCMLHQVYILLSLLKIVACILFPRWIRQQANCYSTRRMELSQVFSTPILPSYIHRECPDSPDRWSCMFEPTTNCTVSLANLEGAPVWSQDEQKR